MPTCARCGFESDAPFRFCPECGTGTTAGSPLHAQRKTVTVLFCDLAGSTALGETLDPERLRELLARYFERMQAIVEHHGGTVEKFIGDAVMAVFGVPAVHEDDALRAVRAALEMRDALPELGLEGRIGVMTGEVVTGTAERLATGDAVNVAARLEQAAAPGEVLLGDPTLALVRGAVDVEPVEPLALKGKAAPVPAHRLLRVHDAPERRHDAPFVGRAHELAVLHAAWNGVRADSRCELVTVVGNGGVGKSRLAAELLASIDARVLRGRCLPYGDGITYWPVVGALKQLGLVPADPAAADAIRSLLGQSDASTSAEEIAWAFRKTLEQAASAAPLVVLFDDIQWAEETFLDLIEHVALLSSGAPILMLCLARPELGELRAGWPVTLRLEPLGAADVDELIPDRISGDLRGRITRAAGGNPLFVEEMVAMADETEGDVTVPPTLRALLAARIDQLEAAERGVLERGSIEGEVFHRSAVQALSSTEVSVTPRLASLVRKELIRPDTPALPGEDGFRFRHLLIRDAAYDALPKAVRAELHERFASWLDEHGTDLVELDEIVGYHLEQAHRYRTELGAPDDRVAAAGRIRLVAAGRNAAARLDFGAAASLLERGLRLAPTEEIDVAVELELVNALNQIGRGIDAVERARSLESRGAARRDRTTELVGRLQATLVQSAIDPSGTNERLDALVAEALPAFQAARDDIALHVAYHASGRAAFVRVRMDSALDAFERAAVHARRTPLAESFLGWRALCRVYGTTPASGILGWLDEHDTSASDPFFRTARARVLALLGRLDDARTLLVEIRSGLADRGQSVVLGAVTGIASTDVELLARDAAAAAALGEAGCRMLEELGDEGFLSSAATCYARALYQLDRLDEAEAWALRAAGLGARDDAFTQVASLSVQANVLARRGDHARAEALAAQATAIADGTDSLWHRGDARAELAEVLVLGGRRDEAVASLREALALYVRKENNVAAARTVERLLELGVEDTRAPRSSAPGTGRRRR